MTPEEHKAHMARREALLARARADLDQMTMASRPFIQAIDVDELRELHTMITALVAHGTDCPTMHCKRYAALASLANLGLCYAIMANAEQNTIALEEQAESGGAS